MRARTPALAAMAFVVSIGLLAGGASIGYGDEPAPASASAQRTARTSARAPLEAAPSPATGDELGTLRASGLAAFRAGRFEEARLALERVAELDPASALARFNLASVEFKLARFAAAERDYLAAAAIDARLAPLATLNAGLAASTADRRRAAGLYRAAAALAPDGTVGARARELLAELEERRRTELRTAAVQRALDGKRALKASDPARAVTLLRAALHEAWLSGMRARDRAEIEYALGHALLAVHDVPAAAQALRRAVAGRPFDSDFHYMLAVALFQSGDTHAADEFTAAIASGLSPDDADRAREYLAVTSTARAVEQTRAPTSRLAVDAEAGLVYDSNYAGGRDVGLVKGVRTATTSGAPELAFLVEPRLRLRGRPSNGLYLGSRLEGNVYLSAEADPFSIVEEDLYLEANWSPTRWLTLQATALADVQTSGVSTLSLYEAGGSVALRATLWEGDSLATRLRYAHVYMNAIDHQFDYLDGDRDDVAVTQSLYSGTWRVGLGYLFRHEGVGSQEAKAATVLTEGDDLEARCYAHFGTVRRNCAGSTVLYPELLYVIPWAYDAHELWLEADGELAYGLRVDLGAHYQHRDYPEDVRIVPDPLYFYHRHRVDERWSFDFALRRRIGLGFSARLTAYVLLSRSTIGNGSTASRFDYDDKNFNRFVGSLDLIRPF